VAALLRDARFTLFLRTDELRDAWRAAFPQARRIDVLPSLELAGVGFDVAAGADATDLGEIRDAVGGSGMARESDRAGAGPVHVAVLGQLRPGKGLDWLVPLLRDRDDVVLTVAGPFFDEAHRAALPMLGGFGGLRAEYLPESELLGLARAQDWLVMLYDGWDARMEAATLFVAARADTPVVALDAGWCGRMLAAFGVGVGVAPGTRPDAQWFAALPKRGDARHAALRAGLARFREAHGAAAMRDRFVAAFALAA
jgi:glycosyltransferase involved in cell wall biosynthesis